MNSKSTKAKRNSLPVMTLSELDRRDGIERYDHLIDPLDRYLASEKKEGADLAEAGETDEGART
ncbi:hypothetical protein LB515_02475 [Mesorhizobium sp. CA15]|uniref:hypothetical protein n=1 Tax=Mesorhizobium sp. CA15 TaxID=2876641 RepID=UPI001CD1334C|nr:hypothetical protein [Mesorhizobium sp. CA15]MBZ9864232.1 hypothetical protein [Mesorhizobium sp. CA15]